MHLTLSPQAGLPGQPETTITVAGDTITIDGTEYDLSPVPEGGEGRPEGAHPFTGPVTRQGGMIHAIVGVRLADTAAAVQPADPAQWLIPDASGTIAIPALPRTVSEGDA